MNIVRFIAAAVAIFSSVVVGANECIPPKPPKISGALCGRLLDSTGAAVPGVGLLVLGESDRVMADVQADSKGDFIFPNLSKGKYRLKATSPGSLIEFGQFEITKSKAACTSPVTVRLDVACCCFGSGIVKKRPRGY